MAERTGPLQGLTIIDCTMAFAGPYGTVLLADLGANVIKVEPPGGDNFRIVPPFPPDYDHAYKHSEAGVDYGMSFAGVAPYWCRFQIVVGCLSFADVPT